MIKQINESFSKKLASTKVDLNKSLLESLKELNEAEEIKETIYIKYWADEERRDQGESDLYLDDFKSRDDAINTAKRLVDRGQAASVEVLVSPTEEIETEDDKVIFGYDGVETWSDFEESLKETIYTRNEDNIEKVQVGDSLKESVEDVRKILEPRITPRDTIKPFGEKEKLPKGFRFKSGTNNAGEITYKGTDYAYTIKNGKLKVMPSSQAGSNWSETIYAVKESKSLKEDFETNIDWDGGIQEITKHDYNYFLNILPPAEPQHHTDGFTGEFLVGEPYTSDEQGRLLFSKFGKKDGKYYFLGTDYARRGTYEESLTEGSKTFLKDLEKDKDEMPKTFTHKNRFNYDIKQLRVDPKSRKYSVGQFNIGDPRYKTHNGKEFDRTIDALKDRGYTEESLKEDFTYMNGHKVKVFYDYTEAKKEAEKLGLKESEYGDKYGTKYSYCLWNKSGDRNEDEDIYAIYTYERINGRLKPRALTKEEIEDVNIKYDLDLDNKLNEEKELSKEDNFNGAFYGNQGRTIKELISYNVDKNGTLHIYLDSNSVADISDCANKSKKELEELIYETLENLGYKLDESLKEKIDYSDEKYLLKPYWYFTTHGVGVGSIPKSVKSIWGSFDADNGTYFATASVIPTKDLQEFEIIEKQPNIDDIPEKVRINIQNWLENPLNEARPRTRKEIRVLQGNYGYGWDDLIEYEIPSDVDEAIKTYKEIRADFKSYEENEPQYPHRTITRYEKITKEN